MLVPFSVVILSWCRQINLCNLRGRLLAGISKGFTNDTCLLLYAVDDFESIPGIGELFH